MTPSLRPFVSLLASLLLLVGVWFAPAAQAQTLPDIPNPSSTQPLPPNVVQSHAMPTLSPEALDRIATYIGEQRDAKLTLSPTERKVHPMLRTDDPTAKAAGPADRNPMLQYDDAGHVRVVLYVAGSGALAEAEARGFRTERYDAADGYATGTLAPSATGAVAAVDGVHRIQPLVKSGVKHAGAVQSEGDAALNAAALRAALGADGSGVRIGIISDGTDGAALSQASGDLPPTIEECPISDNAGGSTVTNAGAEGTAMLEIVHDLAPGASLLFCPAFGGDQPGLAASILSLANDLNADVIVDDVAFLTEPYWEDGIVAQAVDQVKANGVAYFSSAGNGAQQHYEASYVDTFPGDQFFFPDNAHDFGLAAGGPSAIFMNGLVGGTAFAPTNFFAAFLQWNDPFGASGNDYDLYLFDRLGFPAGSPFGIFPVGGLGLAFQDGDDDPLETAFVLNQTPNIEDVLLVVDRFEGDPRELEMNFNGTLAILTFNVREGSVWGHAAARGAQAIAAIDVNDPGLDDAEAFSSEGPSRIFFPAPEVRQKPDLTAVDGVSVTGNGGFPTTFFGTSASAPHAAAIAALLLELNPLLTPDDVYAALASTALDRGVPGVDFVFGAGLVDALAAGRFVADTTPPVCGPVTLAPNGSGDLEGAFVASDAESGIVSVEFTTLINFDGFAGSLGPFAEGDVATFASTPSVEIRGVQQTAGNGGGLMTLITNGAGLTSECDPVVKQLTATLPEAFALHANYPNPVRAGTQIPLDVAEAGRVTLEVFDVLGRKVATLIDRDMEPGTYRIGWTANEVARLSSGTYVYRMRTPTFTASRRLVVVR